MKNYHDREDFVERYLYRLWLRNEFRVTIKPFTTPKGTITIRPAETADAALLRELRLEALANHPEAFAADYAFTAAESADKWAKRVTQVTMDNQGVICIAEAESRLIGMCGLARGHWPKTQHSGAIWGVYVRADWRCCRVAEVLLDACVTWGRAHGLEVVKLAAITPNTPAIRCYTRCGFTVYGIEPKAICYNSVYYDELMMAKQI